MTSDAPRPPVRRDLEAAWVAERVAAGARVVGRTVTVRGRLGVGTLLDDMARPPGHPIDPVVLLRPTIRAAVGFVLAADLTADAIGVPEVEAATGYVVAALEIVDTDAGLFVLGETPHALAEVHLPSCLMTLRRNGDIVSRGTGADCLGDPRAAVAWLAGTTRDRGEPLRAGDAVLSGALGPAVPVSPGDAFTAFISGVGDVAVSFGSSGRAGRAAP